MFYHRDTHNFNNKTMVWSERNTHLTKMQQWSNVFLNDCYEYIVRLYLLVLVFLSSLKYCNKYTVDEVPVLFNWNKYHGLWNVFS